MPTNEIPWDLLERPLPSGARLTVRTADPSRHKDVLIGIDASCNRYLLLALVPGDQGHISERSSRGIAVQTSEFHTHDLGLSRYVEIQCLDNDGHAALDTLANELLDALVAGATIGRIRLIRNVLAKWRRFWSTTSQGLLSRKEQVGLFGELWFLTYWLVPAIGLVAAMKMWKGPTRARNDFEAPLLGIEVKTSSRSDGAHIINGLEQLLEPNDGKLFLFGLQVREEASGTVSLPLLVSEVRTTIGSNHDVRDQFETILIASGYDDRLEGEYGKLLFRIRDEALFRVTDSFPRLIPSSIPAGLPPGVSELQYELRLDAARQWLAASTASDARPVLLSAAANLLFDES